MPSLVERELLGICKHSMLQLGDQLRKYVDQLHADENINDINGVILMAAKELYTKGTNSNPSSASMEAMLAVGGAGIRSASGTIESITESPLADNGILSGIETAVPSASRQAYSTSGDSYMEDVKPDKTAISSIHSNNVHSDLQLVESGSDNNNEVIQLFSGNFDPEFSWPEAGTSSGPPLPTLTAVPALRQQQDALQQHLERQVPSSSHQQQTPSKYFKTKSGKIRKLQSPNQRSSTGPRMRFHRTCFYCGSDDYPSGLLKHVTGVHADRLVRMDPNNPEIVEFPCPRCVRTFSDVNSCYRHMALHKDDQQIFPCTICPHVAKDEDGLVAHMIIHQS